MREHSELSELNDLAVAYRKLLGDIAGAKEMLADPELREMAEEELRSLEAQLEEKTHEARLALLPKDPDDRKNALIEVRAGAGGDEMCIRDRCRAARSTTSPARARSSCEGVNPSKRASGALRTKAGGRESSTWTDGGGAQDANADYGGAQLYWKRGARAAGGRSGRGGRDGGRARRRMAGDRLFPVRLLSLIHI